MADDEKTLALSDDDNTELVSTWQKRVDDVKNSRILWETMVATCMHFNAGVQTIWWDRTGYIRQKAIESQEVFRIINLFPTALSVIESRLTVNDPRWNPRKSGLENPTDEEVDAADALLQDMWDGSLLGERSIKRALKIVIRYSWLQGGRLVYFRFDEEEQVPVMDSFSLWDVYMDLSAKPLYEKQWIDIPIPMGIKQLQSAAKDYEGPGTWNTELVNKLQADNILAQSQLKQQYMRDNMGRSEVVRDTALIHQTFEVKDGKIEHCLIAQSGLLYKCELPYKNLSEIFDIFYPIEDDETYTRPLCYDWIEPQKSVNKMYSNIENYIDTMLQGKWILSNDAVSVPRAGQQGQKLIAGPGEVTQLQMQPLPNTHFAHLQQALSQFEQISGVHSESLGRISGSADSGVAIAQLQALDEQNSASPVDNFKLFLQRIGVKMLNIASANWSDTKTLYRYDKRTGEESMYSVVGEEFIDARKESLEEGTVAIRPFKRLDVEMVVGAFFHSAEMRRQLTDLLSVWQPGANPATDQIMLPMVSDAFSIGVGRDLVKHLKVLQNPQMMIAEGKAQLIVEGQDVPVNPEDPHEFLQNFYAQRAKIALENGDQQAAQRLNAQAQKHAMFLQQQGPAGGSGIPEAPQVPEEIAPQNQPFQQEAPPEQIPAAQGGQDPLAAILGQ